MTSPSTTILRDTLLRPGSKYDAHLLSLRHRDGVEEERVIVRHPGACVIVPVLSDGRLVLIRNRRVTLDATILEFPAGTRRPNEDPASCARRELQEETGFEARALTPLGSFFTAPGLTDERMFAFLAADLRHVGASPEPDEDLGVELHSLAGVWSMVDSGQLIDAKSIVALLLAQRRDGLHGVLDGT